MGSSAHLCPRGKGKELGSAILAPGSLRPLQEEEGDEIALGLLSVTPERLVLDS